MIRDLLLARRGVAFVTTTGTPLPDAPLRALDLELAHLGFVMSHRLRARLATASAQEVIDFHTHAIETLSEHLGADVKHEPLFRKFPEDIPNDTLALWWKKVLVHFLQGVDQPCLFCGRIGATHVLSPCAHVVCSHCFDGASYSACPSCEHHVDRSSPFFLPTPERPLPNEQITFKRLDLGESEVDETRALFASLCARKQALSPDDRDALLDVINEYRERVLDWLPDEIPLRENIALLFGTLAKSCAPAAVLPHAQRHMRTATDVLRFIAVLSGANAALASETFFMKVEERDPNGPFWSVISKFLTGRQWIASHHTVHVPMRVHRFKVAKMSRPLRRMLLALLESFPVERLIEDMLRHRAYWIWVGEFLHPGEYAKRYPNVARGFDVLRNRAPFQTWASRLEAAVRRRASAEMLDVLNERPGELARRFDHALRIAGDDAAARQRVIDAFVARVPQLATPVLLTLRAHLPQRLHRAPIRVYWPKRIATGVAAYDARTPLTEASIAAPLRAIEDELLRRFAQKPHFDVGIVDEALRDIPVPFNERTASRSAVSLPRGSRVAVPDDRDLRLFLHWCEPPESQSTDLDLSVVFYDEYWKYQGVCSYYQLQYEKVATSSGDLRNAPWPDGATEFVDVYREEARKLKLRYAVMSVTNYSGLPFSQLPRGFAGVMLRRDKMGAHLDPRTVELRFDVQGEHGVFLPFVVDLQESVLHWLDIQTKGELQMNNVEKSRNQIATVCPSLITYFASGTRPSMFDLAMLHARSRCRNVIVRNRDTVLPTLTSPTLAFLHRGDIDLPEDSDVYALFRERVTPNVAASDLLS